MKTGSFILTFDIALRYHNFSKTRKGVDNKIEMLMNATLGKYPASKAKLFLDKVFIHAISPEPYAGCEKKEK